MRQTISPEVEKKFPAEADAYRAAYQAAIQAVQIAEAQIGGDRGACGFAWCEVHPGTSRVARFLKAAGIGRKGWAGGVVVWNPGEYAGQSVHIVEAGANAFAKVLQLETNERDIRVSSRLD